MGRAWITQLRGAILRSGAALVIALAAASGQGVMAQEGSTGVQVTLPESASEEPLTGRLFLFVTQRGGNR